MRLPMGSSDESAGAAGATPLSALVVEAGPVRAVATLLAPAHQDQSSGPPSTPRTYNPPSRTFSGAVDLQRSQDRSPNTSGPRAVGWQLGGNSNGV
jgi:hypothetical protein